MAQTRPVWLVRLVVAIFLLNLPIAAFLSRLLLL